MIDDPVPLVRRFSHVPRSEAHSDEQELSLIMGDHKPTDWEELEDEFRCVLLAEAGAGKTFEMEARARQVREDGREAFFIRIEDIEDGFESAFEIGSASAFDSWLSSQDHAWFFLDSIDEARLAHPRCFEKAIRHFADRIRPAQHRARIYISSRPYAWRAKSDHDLVKRYLPLIKPKSKAVDDTVRSSERTNDEQHSEQESALRVYILAPLNEDDIRTFAAHRGTPQVEKLIDEISRANLLSLAERPFDLEGILSKWKSDQKLDGRLELLRHNINLRLEEIDPNRDQLQPLNKAKAMRGAQLLAAAVVLSGEPGIRVPDSGTSSAGISAKDVLKDWDPKEIQALLERGIFNDVLYGFVRFRHREVRELLAAEWFSDQLHNGSSRNETENLFFREQYGCLIITPRLRPVLPWLILMDVGVRQKALQMAPEVAVEGGDAAHLPFSERQAILRDLVARIAADNDDRSVRDNSAIARIAQLDLSGEVHSLIERYRGNDDVLFFLGRLVWQGEMKECIPTLLEVALDLDLGIYARIAATRAVMTCGERVDIESLWRQLLTLNARLPRRLLAEILSNAVPDLTSVELLIGSINTVESHQRFSTNGLRKTLHSFINRLPIINDLVSAEPLAILASGLNEFLDREPHIERRDCHVSEEFVWLLGPATHAVERLVTVRSNAALSSDALSIMLKVPVVRFWRDSDFGEYKSNLNELVPVWKNLNDKLFWRSVKEERQRLEEKGSRRLRDASWLQHIGHYWNFSVTRFDDVLDFVRSRDFLDDKLVALSQAHRLFLDAQRPEGGLRKLKEIVRDNFDLSEHLDSFLNPKKSQDEIEWEAEEARREEEKRRKKIQHEHNRNEWVARLKSSPERVRSPSGLKADELSNDQYWLLREILGPDLGDGRSAGADWGALIPEFGDDVAKAYRDAAISYWRKYKPGLRSEGHDTSSIPYSVFFAMAGLEIESREVGGFPADLSEAEVSHALRYFVWELNGFPSWLEPMCRAHPELAINAIFTELLWELENTDTEQNLHYILQDLSYNAGWLHPHLAPLILNWLKLNHLQSDKALRHCIQIIRSGGVERLHLSKLAQLKITHDPAEDHLATWHALWIDVEAEEGILAAKKWLESLPADDACNDAQRLVTDLMGWRQFSSIGPGHGDFYRAAHLQSLYMFMHEYIRPENDIHRAGTGVYSPTLRDDAQDARDSILNKLSETPGKETYVALSQLANEHPSIDHRSWIKRLAHRRAEVDGDLEPWLAQQVAEYDQHQVLTPTTHRQLFDLTVYRLTDLKAWIERGNDSPYKTWQRADNEPEMRNLIAGWLNNNSKGRYTCAQENELSNSKQPDIWTQITGSASPVPIELKVLDKNWSGPTLCERLCNQLAGDYLREEGADCGVFLLVWQGRSSRRHWEIDGKRVELQGLPTALSRYWEKISDDFPGVSAIEVILVDLTVREPKSET